MAQVCTRAQCQMPPAPRLTRSRSRASQGSVDDSIANTNSQAKKQHELDDSFHSLASSAENAEQEEDIFTEEEETGLDRPAGPPQSDMRYHRRLFIMKGTSLTGQLCRLPHPHSGADVLYFLDERAEPFELMQLDQWNKRPHSIFFGNSVVADPGPILMFLPVHPLFLVLGHLRAKACDNFLGLEEILNDKQFGELSRLANCEKLIQSLKIAADYQKEDDKQFRLNEGKLMCWLEHRFQLLVKSVRKNVQEMDSMDESALRQYSFGILADYLSVTLAEQLRTRLGIADEEGRENREKGDSNRKRNGTIPASPQIEPPAKKRITKVLAAASKGTKSLTSFFGSNQQKAAEKKAKD